MGCEMSIFPLGQVESGFGIDEHGITNEVIFRYHPVFLNPHVPKEGECLDAYLLREYGFTKEYAHSPEYPLHQAGREVGVQFNPHRRVVNTFDAFCLICVAERRGLQTEAVKLLSQKYFEDAQDISDTAVLLAAARDMVWVMW